MTTPTEKPATEPGGGKFLLIVAIVIATSLGGTLWAFLSLGKLGMGKAPAAPAAAHAAKP
ncbi:MAG: hypothetical protein M0P39_09660 [Rhodocyclaceae bacterium]|jgi:hypothetical protein|nr:hypothetical protein [Rhodocyclaceae bacterium]